MMDFISPLFGWSSLGTAIICACIAVAWFLPPFRRYAIMVAGATLGALWIYAKGYRDSNRRTRAQRDKMVGRLENEYREIDNQPDDVRDTVDRMRNNGF
jgi:hypothetical protein